MKGTKNLEMLAILIGIASIPADLMKDFSRQTRAYSPYNPCFDPRNVRKICSLKYVRHPVYAKNSSFYQNRG